MRYLLLFVLSILLSIALRAEDNCSLTLENAQKMYDNGMIEKIPEMLEPCIKNGFTQEERLQAYKLIILSNIFNNSMSEADKNMLSFLKKYPEYELTATDPAEFAQLFKTYRTNAISSISFSVGANNSYARVKNWYSTADQKASASYTPVISYQAGIFLNYNLISKLDLGSGLSYISQAWTYKDNKLLGKKAQLTYDETQSSLIVPVYLLYNFYRFQKLDFWVKPGFELQYLLSANASPKKIDENAKPTTSSQYSIKDKRTTLNYNGLLSLVIEYKMKKSALKLEIGHSKGFNNRMIESERYNSTNKDILYERDSYSFIDNNFNIDRMYANIVYSFKFFKPEKK